jgi:hypothetical protein
MMLFNAVVFICVLVAITHGQLTPTELYEGDVALTVRDMGKNVALRGTQLIASGHETSYGPQLWAFTRTGVNTWSAGTKFTYPAGVTKALGQDNVYMEDDLLFAHVDDAANSGVAVYRWTTVWTFEILLQPPLSESTNYRFGQNRNSIRYENGVVVIGDWGYTSFTGQAYIWENAAGSTWTYRGVLNSPVSSETGAEFAHSVCIDGDYIAVNEPMKVVSGFIGQGQVHIYKRSGNTWPHHQTLTSDQSTSSYVYFGSNLDCNGGRMLLTENKASGALHYFQLVTTTWTFRSTRYISDVDNKYTTDLKIKGTKSSATVSNAVHFMSLSGTTWNDVFVFTDGTKMTGSAYDIDFVNERMATGNSEYNTNGGVAEGIVYAYEGLTTLPPTAAPTNPTPAPTNPTPEPTLGPTNSPTTPQPTKSPTLPPTQPVLKSLAVAQIKFSVMNTTKKNEIINDFIEQVNVAFPQNPNYDVTKVIKMINSGTLTLELIQSVNNQTKLEEAFKDIHCGALKEYCTVTIDYYNRRALMTRELATNLPIEITFYIPESLYNLLDGLELDDSTFEQAIADALGIDLNSTTILVHTTGSTITVDATLSAEVGGDPFDTTLIDASNDLQNDMETIIAALVAEAGGGEDTYVITTAIDLCPPARTCNGRGTCDTGTGICTCVGDWWGIDCETPCECGTSGECVNAYCVCQYPYFGLRCDNEVDCSC